MMPSFPPPSTLVLIASGGAVAGFALLGGAWQLAAGLVAVILGTLAFLAALDLRDAWRTRRDLRRARGATAHYACTACGFRLATDGHAVLKCPRCGEREETVH